MTSEFERIISIDWSGAGEETDLVGLRIAVWDHSTDQSYIRLPSPVSNRRNWRRSECRAFLREALSQPQRTLVALDFCLGLPCGSDRVVFGVNGWREMVRQIGQVYSSAKTARLAAQRINSWEKFKNHGPYRFDEHRNDFRFYIDQGIAYYRLTELAAPQAISPWYLGSGGTVGFHTISGLAAIDYLLREREQGRLEFFVWPFEPVDSNRHAIVESYPALTPACVDGGQCKGGDEQDAWKVLQQLVVANKDRTIDRWFHPTACPFGRIENVSFADQIAIEGFIFGLR